MWLCYYVMVNSLRPGDAYMCAWNTGEQTFSFQEEQKLRKAEKNNSFNSFYPSGAETAIFKDN